jgi:hypothetical protein
MYANLSLPLKSGISKPPMRIINWGGSGLFIVVLVSHY